MAAHDRHPPARLVWDDSLKLGDPVVDEQHAALFSISNRLLDHPGATTQAEVIVDILSEIGKFLILHFETEEALMRKNGMPSEQFEQHCDAHRRIIEQYAELNLAATYGKHRSSREVFGLIREWLVDHLHDYDLDLKKYLLPVST